MQRTVSILPGTTAARLYGAAQATEDYFCNYGINPAYRHHLPDLDADLQGMSVYSTLMRVALGVLFVLCTTCTTPAAHASEAIWEGLRAPGSILIVRHSYAPGTFDPPGAKLDDCTTQRNLDESGRAQARRMGEEFRTRAIVLGPILSSPRCRCLETARLAFGSAESWLPLQGALRESPLRASQLAEIRQRMARHTSGPPHVLVTHGFTITDLTGLDIRMGAFIVLRRAADGSHAVVGDLFIE
jgi:phosphohistidine phosphatase SixA